VDVIEVSSQQRRQLVDVTSFVQEAVAASVVVDGLCHVCAPHTTAAVMLNENADPAVGDDILRALDAAVPKVAWRHAEGNSDAHLLSALIGTALSIPISDGALALGRWQAVFLVELDGPRKRELWVTCLRA
jgi:secondary thiamine-phosphate synthase enzyme